MFSQLSTSFSCFYFEGRSRNSGVLLHRARHKHISSRVDHHLTSLPPSLQFQFSQIIAIWRPEVHASSHRRAASTLFCKLRKRRENIWRSRLLSSSANLAANKLTANPPKNTQKWTKRRLRKNLISGSSNSTNASSCRRDK